jgi:diguanylate cyclase (GGDEF)-like protein
MLSFDADLGGLVSLSSDRRAKLLIVDDQPINIEVLYRLFAHDHQVFMATTGEQALAIASAERPDLILLDLVMPGMSGYDLCQMLKNQADTHDTPIIFVTAMHEAEQETRALEIGGVDFITKPINPAAVRARVKTHLTLKFHSDLLKRMAFLDAMTGLFNRRYFDDRISMEWGRAERDKTTLGVVMIDVDFFKQFNDHYGHPKGDDCLRSVGLALKQAVKRPGDVVTRYGGEEFACVLPDTNLEGARLVAQRLIAAVSGLLIPHEKSTVAQTVTASAGFAVVIAPHADGDLKTLISAADSQLYEAKRMGRAQVCGRAF